METLNPTIGSRPAFRLKGGMFTLTVLQLLSADMTAFVKQLEKSIQQAPNFFNNAPILVDLQNMQDSTEEINFNTLTKELKQHGVIPVGVGNGTESQLAKAAAAGFGTLSTLRSEKKDSASSAPADDEASALIITQPVRSGQQIYAQHRDLIVLAAVSAGAELLADGNIHVYGPLRGRAIAGANGNKKARIFCQTLQAELISIAGIYRLSEDMPAVPAATHIQVYLDEEQLRVATI